MTAPTLAWTDFGGDHDAPLLVLGPSLGTDVRTLWAEVAAAITDTRHVIGWDLPGHGDSPPATGFSMADLAAAVAGEVEDATFDYAGDSTGGAVGLRLLLDHPGRISTATLVATGTTIGEPASWLARAKSVRANGMAVMRETSPRAWYADPSLTSPARSALLRTLVSADADSYASVCEALAAHDVRDRLAEISGPVLAVAGGADQVTPTGSLRQIAEGVQHGRLEIIDDAAHLPPVEQPAVMAALIRDGLGSLDEPDPRADSRANGMRVRREVLGDEHVDRAAAGVTDLTADFQEFITRYAWGEIWTRPGLDRRSRSMITITALIALGHDEELAMHVRAARTNGLSDEEIGEVILHSAIYCGVPAANAAFRIAQRVLAEN